MQGERDDEQLLQAWRAGERAAGNLLLRRHFPAIFRFFASKVDCPEDLAQRTFQACVESRDRIEGRVRPYLYGVARNQLLMFFRANGRYQKRFSPQEHSVAASLASPSQLVANQEDQRLLLIALRELPLDLQITIELFYWEDLSVAEVATVTGVPTGTAKSRLHRARASLKQALEQASHDEAALDHSMRSLRGWASNVRRAHGRSADD